MTETTPLSVTSTTRASYGFVRGAIKPALAGSLIYAATSLVSDYIARNLVFGDFSFLVSSCLLTGMGVCWLAMALRAGLGQERRGLMGLSFGRQELWLAMSLIGFVFVTTLIALLVAFFVFLFIMIVAAIGGGALSGADIVDAPIYEDPQAFGAFLSGTTIGNVVGVIGGLTLAGAFGFMLWLVLRLSPFAAGVIDQKRFIVLQAMAWTRYKDRALMGAGLLSIGAAVLVLVGGRWLVGLAGLPVSIGVPLGHLLACFGALFVVGFICEVYRETGGKTEYATGR